MPPTEEDIAWFRSTFHPIPKARLPDDCVEYSLYLFSADDLQKDFECRSRLREIQKHSSVLQKRWLKDYIWQRQGFSLEIVNEDGLTFLRGRTEYGDSVEDEWVVVWLLRELTKSFSDLWIKVGDNDGEFLLIEAAESLPAWLESEVADNRVWIHDGGLQIIKPRHESRKPKSDDAPKLSVLQAREIALNEPKRLMRSTMIEEEAFYRLRNYPNQILNNMHHALVTLPRRIAFLLKQKPSYISPAIEAFYLRDPIALKPLQTNDMSVLHFKADDLVDVSVKLPRAAYAQLRSQDFDPPPIWKGHMPSKADTQYLRAETGMKISCGFEMLVTDTHNQDKAAVREIKMLLEDLETGDEQLPSNKEVDQWTKQEDDEKWLDISIDDLEGELAGKGGKKSGNPAGFGDRMAQENLQRIVAQFESMMNEDEADPNEKGLFDDDSEDVDEDSSDEQPSDGEDLDTSFDETQFKKMMREMMGMPADTDVDAKTIRDMVPGVVQELESDGEEENADDVQTLMSRMEAELNERGVLESTQTKSRKGKERAVDEHQNSIPRDSKDGDIDTDFARNLVQAFKGQKASTSRDGRPSSGLGVE